MTFVHFLVSKYSEYSASLTNEQIYVVFFQGIVITPLLLLLFVSILILRCCFNG